MACIHGHGDRIAGLTNYHFMLGVLLGKAGADTLDGFISEHLHTVEHQQITTHKHRTPTAARTASNHQNHRQASKHHHQPLLSSYPSALSLGTVASPGSAGTPPNSR